MPSLGTGSPWSTQGDYNSIIFAAQQLLQKMQTATLVQVVSCTVDGALGPIGTVNVTPLVNQVDPNGNPTPHTTVFGLPYFRPQAGTNGIIMDPQPGDIGAAVFASRDISKVQSTQAQANPGSARQYDYADGIYLGTVLSAAAPTQYLLFAEAGITLATPNAIDIKATGNIILSGDSIQAGASPAPVVTKAFITEWINGLLRPALLSAGITVAAPSPDALTTTFEAS